MKQQGNLVKYLKEMKKENINAHEQNKQLRHQNNEINKNLDGISQRFSHFFGKFDKKE